MPDLFQTENTTIEWVLQSCKRLLVSGAKKSAEDLVRKALIREPAHHGLLLVLGDILAEDGRQREAIVFYKEALEANPNVSAAKENMAAALLELGEAQQALNLCYDVIKTAPLSIAAAINGSGAAIALGRYQEAADLARGAISIAPEMAEAWLNLGVAHDRLGDYAAANIAYEAALALVPGLAKARFNRAMLWLRRGYYATAWPEYETRLAVTSTFVPRGRRWQKEPLAGRRLLLQAEQGFGDSIQFVRFASCLAAQGGQLLLEVPPETASLLATAPGITRTVLPEDEVAFDYSLPLLSLPFMLGEAIGLKTEAIPYLSVDAERLCFWQSRIDALASGSPAFGLVWAGRKSHAADCDRSIPFTNLMPLLQVPSWHGISLQKERAEAGRSVPCLAPWGEELTNFADTAALIMALDLVVTVDTAVAHLAGALGKPTILLLPKACDWRWGESGESTQWYPSIKLLRQEVHGAWLPVVETAVALLRDRS